MRKHTSIYIWLIALGIVTVCVFSTISCRGQSTSDTPTGMTVKLPAPAFDGKTSVEKAMRERRSVRSYSDDPLTLSQVSQLLWAAQGITDTARGFRTAPSAGALYPLEVYIVAGNVTDLPAGIYRYVPADHTLELVVEGDQRKALADAALGQTQIAEAPASIAITANIAKTTARYRDKAPRFVHIEVGHVGQNVSLQAVSLGLSTVPVGAMEDASVKQVLDLPSEQDPLYIIPVGRGK